MQKINLIAQGILELSNREKGYQQRHPSGLNYSPRRNVFRRGQSGNQRVLQSYFHPTARQWTIQMNRLLPR